jgi:hypothetical protein
MSKWSAVGGDKALADVAPEEIRNIYDETLGVPPAGPYLASVKRFHKGETGPNSKNPGTPKIVLLVEIAEPAKTKKATYNGYGIWSHQYVVTDENAGRVNQLLLALLDNTSLTAAKKKAVLQAFHSGNVVVDDKTDRITKIGTWTVPEDMVIGISTRKEKFGGNDVLGIQSVMPASQRPAPKAVEEDVEDDDEDVEPDEEELEDDEEETDEEEVEEDAEDEGNPEEDRLAELLELGRAAMRPIAKELEIRVLKSMSDEDLANAIVDVEFAAAEEAADDEEDDEDDEPEPEPPAKRGRPAAKAASPARPAAKRRSAKDDEPPF